MFEGFGLIFTKKEHQACLLVDLNLTISEYPRLTLRWDCVAVSIIEF